MRALVTGANGFLGRHVVAALVARGHQVRALVRPAASVEGLEWPSSVEIFRADLRTTSDLERALDGADVLMHLAAVVTGGEDLQFAGTVIATERLLDAMARTSCRRMVLASSFAVYDWSASRRTLDERSPIKSVPDLYEAGRPQNRQMLARAHYPPLRGAAPLGPDRAAPGLHLGP